jgi:site-specific DNA-methyltransferase (adenine-specific)
MDANRLTPYYSRDGITIYHGDCRGILPHLPKVDLVLTDPPYPDLHTGRFRYEAGLIDFFKEMPCRQIIFWSAKMPFPLDYTAIHIWDKITRCRSEYERIFERNGHLKYKMFRYHCIGNVIDAQFMRDVFTSHPTQKPRRLMNALVSRYSKESDLILDPFMGSGTTLVAAKQLGRRAIGIEIEEKYCEIAVERLAQGVLELNGRVTADP